MGKYYANCAVCNEAGDLDDMKSCRTDSHSICESKACSMYGTDEDPSLVTECEYKTALPDCKCKFCSVLPCPACATINNPKTDKEKIADLQIELARQKAIIEKHDATIAKNKKRLKRLDCRFKAAMAKKQVKA